MEGPLGSCGDVLQKQPVRSTVSLSDGPPWVIVGSCPCPSSDPGLDRFWTQQHAHLPRTCNRPRPGLNLVGDLSTSSQAPRGTRHTLTSRDVWGNSQFLLVPTDEETPGRVPSWKGPRRTLTSRSRPSTSDTRSTRILTGWFQLRTQGLVGRGGSLVGLPVTRQSSRQWNHGDSDPPVSNLEPPQPMTGVPTGARGVGVSSQVLGVQTRCGWEWDDQVTRERHELDYGKSPTRRSDPVCGSPLCLCLRSTVEVLAH